MYAVRDGARPSENDWNGRVHDISTTWHQYELWFKLNFDN